MAHTALLLLDTVEQRGLDPEVVWRGMHIERSRWSRRGERISWAMWVELLARLEQAAPMPIEDLFVPGGGARIGHPFVQIAQGLLTLRDLYRLFACWGVVRSFSVMHARFEGRGGSRARFVVSIDPKYPGSLPTLRYMIGILRHMPLLQGYPAARVTFAATPTPHYGEFELELPADKPFLTRARRLLRVFGSVATALDELEQQASEIATKNRQLERQLDETRDTAAALRERDQWLEVALDAGSIGLWRWDPMARIARVSGGLVEWLETGGRSELDGSEWGARIHPDDMPKLIDTIRRALTERTRTECEYRILRSNGKIMWIRATGRGEVDAEGHEYAYGSALDITRDKLMENRLSLADRLIAAGTLAAGVAHEINNPLTYALGSIELATRRLSEHPSADAALRELLVQAHDGLDRIRSVVADVRSFARHDDDAAAWVDPRSICSSALRIVASDLRHRAQVTTELAADTPGVLANAARLGQVVINLLLNASQAMPERDASENRIVLRTCRLPDGEAAIEVEDNGIGIAPDVLPRLFDPFFTTKPVGVGTGLGLSVCQGIVAAFGGRIEVDSQLGRGSTFRVRLPAASAPEDAAVADPVPLASGGHVLVIDDEPMIRQVVARSLESQGYRVDEAENGRAGLERLVDGNQYHAILCDLMMPDLDGAALFDELARSRPDLAARVVFISGGAVTERMRAFMARQDVVVLHKPFELEQLVATIERVARA